MKNKYNQSDLWESIFINNIDRLSRENLSNFRKSGNINNRISAWDPQEKSVRYFKTLLMKFCSDLDVDFSKNDLDFYKFVSQIKKQNLGSPITVNYSQLKLSIDYALSMEEILFINEHMHNISNILEIGAGFGRTCHSFLSTYSHIKQYIICDLPEMLNFSSMYLKEVLSKKLFEKILFIENDKIEKIEQVDLTININSFQEIQKNVVKNYMKVISTKSSFFFCKNPICKYHPEVIGLEIKNKKEYENALSLGLCNDVADIFNNVEMKSVQQKYIKSYKPENFNLLKDKKSDLWWQYHSVLYKKN